MRALGIRLGERGSFLPIEGDVASEVDVRGAVEQCALTFGSLDILVNNAAIELMGAVVDFSEEDWDRMLAVNLKGAFLFCKYAIPQMRGRRGAIVNISSVHAFVSYSGFAAYDASKSGLVGLTRALALDHAEMGFESTRSALGMLTRHCCTSGWSTRRDDDTWRLTWHH